MLYYLTFGTVIGQVIFPVWFFQGMERMKYITFLNITAKLIFTVSIFIFVHNVSDYIYVPLINSLGFIVAGILALWIVFREFKVEFYIPNISIVLSYLKDSTQFFLSRVSVSVYTISNTFIIGILLGNKMVGFYSASEKIFRALVGLYQPLNNALYPYISKMKDMKLFKKIFYIISLVNMFLWGIVLVFSNNIVEILYGGGFNISSALLKIFSVLGIIMCPTILIGYPFVAALGYPEYANYSVIVASFIHLILLLIISPVINIYLVAFITIFSQMFVLLIRFYGIKKHNLWKEKCVG
ncbi:hypothetical protein JCM13304A_21300 [Desulfothermus okinawensis JCM 13304]